MGAWFCAGCVEGSLYLNPPLCPRCGRPFAQAILCQECLARPSSLTGIRSVTWHVSPIADAVHALKYEGLRVLAEPLGEMLARYCELAALPTGIVVPVPLHPSRLRERGYNQSLLLAKALTRRIGLPLEPALLIRERNTRSQVGLSPAARHANVAGAFRCQSTSLDGERVLLIDDVMTTGATTVACADALLAVGAAEVWALTLSRAVG
jgi:ComF family protein